MKVKLIIGLLAAMIVGYWFYTKMFVGKHYEKADAITVAVKDLNNELGANKEKYDGKRILFEGYLGYDESSFNSKSNVPVSSGIFADKVYNIGVFDDVPEQKTKNKCIDITLPKTKGANGFDITKANYFTNEDINYTTNEKEKLTYKEKVQISATVKYYCIDNFNTKQQECFLENPITKKPAYYFYLVDIRLDKK